MELNTSISSHRMKGKPSYISRKPICFVDDDPNERERVIKYLGDKFVIGTGGSIEAAINNLKEITIRKPHLFLLDLYFPQGGRPPSDQELKELEIARQDYLMAELQFTNTLSRLRQTRDGGLELAEEVKRRKGVFAFFSRKATYEDAICAIRYGAVKLIKKPDPTPDEITSHVPLNKAYDIAFADSVNKGNMINEILTALRFTSIWHRIPRWAFAIANIVIGIIISISGRVIYESRHIFGL